MPDQSDASSSLGGNMTTGELRHVITERDRFYLAQIGALEKRMTDFKDAADRALHLAKVSNDKAGEQLAEALIAYKNGANEWQSTFREFRSGTLSRTETFSELGAVRTLIDKLTERVNEITRQHSRDSGSVDTTEAHRVQANWRVGIAVTITAVVLGLLYFIVGRLG